MTIKDLETKQTTLLYNLLAIFEQEDISPTKMELNKLLYIDDVGEKVGWQLSVTYTKVEGMDSTEFTLTIIKGI